MVAKRCHVFASLGSFLFKFLSNEVIPAECYLVENSKAMTNLFLQKWKFQMLLLANADTMGYWAWRLPIQCGINNIAWMRKKHGKTSNPTLLRASQCSNHYLLPLNKVRLRTEESHLHLAYRHHEPTQSQPPAIICTLSGAPSIHPVSSKSSTLRLALPPSFPSPLMFHVMMAGEERYVIM